MNDQMLSGWLAETLERYLGRYPNESSLSRRLASVCAGEHEQRLDLRDRTRLPFHLTASAIVVRRGRALLVWHPALRRWLQPGGHLQAWETPWRGAQRELLEETGLHSIDSFGAGSPEPLDIDLHEIPPNPARAEPAHLHLDLRFSLSCPSGEVATHGSAWHEIAIGSNGGGLPPSLLRAFAKAGGGRR